MTAFATIALMLAGTDPNPIQWVLFFAFLIPIVLGGILVVKIVWYWFVSDLKIIFAKEG